MKDTGYLQYIVDLNLHQKIIEHDVPYPKDRQVAESMLKDQALTGQASKAAMGEMIGNGTPVA